MCVGVGVHVCVFACETDRQTDRKRESETDRENIFVYVRMCVMYVCTPS